MRIRFSFWFSVGRLMTEEDDGLALVGTNDHVRAALANLDAPGTSQPSAQVSRLHGRDLSGEAPAA